MPAGPRAEKEGKKEREEKEEKGIIWEIGVANTTLSGTSGTV